MFVKTYNVSLVFQAFVRFRKTPENVSVSGLVQMQG